MNIWHFSFFMYMYIFCCKSFKLSYHYMMYREKVFIIYGIKIKKSLIKYVNNCHGLLQWILCFFLWHFHFSKHIINYIIMWIYKLKNKNCTIISHLNWNTHKYCLRNRTHHWGPDGMIVTDQSALKHWATEAEVWGPLNVWGLTGRSL